MTTHELSRATEALITATEAVGASSDLDDTTAAIAALAEALHDAGDACDGVALRAIPEVLDGTICDRYRSTADAWPAPSRPTHEQLTAILSTLHDTAAATRLAGRRCQGAVHAVAATRGADDDAH